MVLRVPRKNRTVKNRNLPKKAKAKQDDDQAASLTPSAPSASSSSAAWAKQPPPRPPLPPLAPPALAPPPGPVPPPPGIFPPAEVVAHELAAAAAAAAKPAAPAAAAMQGTCAAAEVEPAEPVQGACAAAEVEPAKPAAPAPAAMQGACAADEAEPAEPAAPAPAAMQGACAAEEAEPAEPAAPAPAAMQGDGGAAEEAEPADPAKGKGVELDLPEKHDRDKKVVFTCEAARQTRNEVSCKQANKYLTKMRNKYSGDWCRVMNKWWHMITGDYEDLTDCWDFDWKAYIAQHKDCDDIIGEGVVGFEFRFINVVDPNRRQYRGDFVVRRKDGTAVRLHPGCAGETIPIVGPLSQWLIGTGPITDQDDPDARAAMQGMGRDAWSFQNISQSDICGRDLAVRFIKMHVDKWKHDLKHALLSVAFPTLRPCSPDALHVLASAGRCDVSAMLLPCSWLPMLLSCRLLLLRYIIRNSNYNPSCSCHTCDTPVCPRLLAGVLLGQREPRSVLHGHHEGSLPLVVVPAEPAVGPRYLQERHRQCLAGAAAQRRGCFPHGDEGWRCRRHHPGPEEV